MELTNEQKKIIIDLLLQLSLPLSQAPVVLEIVEILKKQVEKRG